MIHHSSIYKYFDKYAQIAPLSLSLWRAGEAQQLAQNKAKLVSPILDIGCGFGEFCRIFFSRPVEYGIDINHKDLQIAQRTGCYTNLIHADARKIPLKNNSIQTVLSISVLEHIAKREQVVQEAFRVLKPQGSFIITVPTTSMNDHLLINALFPAKSFPLLNKLYIYLYHHVFHHNGIYPTDTWIQLLKDAGFVNIKTTPTISVNQLHLFEVLLLFALPSQMWRLLFGVRGAVAGNLRSYICKKMFPAVLAEKPQGAINLMITATKP